MLTEEIKPGAVGPRELESLSHLIHQVERPRLVGEGQTIELPDEIFRLMKKAVEAMRSGESFFFIKGDEVLTTQMAADFLAVSRPFLIGLLESGEIPYHKTGTHRRITFYDLMRYRNERDRLRKNTLDDFFDGVISDGAYD